MITFFNTVGMSLFPLPAEAQIEKGALICECTLFCPAPLYFSRTKSPIFLSILEMCFVSQSITILFAWIMTVRLPPEVS